MSGHNRKKGHGLERDALSLPGNRGDRSMSTLSKASGSVHRLSGSTRKTLLGIRNIKDPFSDETQKAIKGFHDYIMTASADDINLEECSLLLSSSAKLFGMQIKTATKHMDELAAFVTNTAKEPVPENEEGEESANNPKKKERKRKEKVDPKDVAQDGSDPTTSQIDPSSCNSTNVETGNTEGNPSPLQLESTVNGSAASNVLAPDSDKQNDESLALAKSTILDAGECSAGDSAGDPSVIEALSESIVEMDTGAGELNSSEQDSTVQMGDSTETAGLALGATVASTCDINKSDLPSTSVDSPTVDEKINEASSQAQSSAADPSKDGADAVAANPPVPVNTACRIIIPDRRAKRLIKEKLEGSPTKRRKLNSLLPPQLISIFDLDLERDSEEWDEDDSDSEPPILYPEVDLWNGQFDLSADPDDPDDPEDHVESALPLVEKLESLQIVSQGGQGSAVMEVVGTDNNAEGLTIISEQVSSVADAMPSVDVATKSVIANDTITSTESNLCTTLVDDVNTSAPVVVSSVSAEVPTMNNLPVLAAEDQQEIQNCINQLHYLPFTCELTKEELARTFHSTVGHLETIFKKNNMPFNRQLLKAATVVCANMVSSFSHRPSDDEHPPGEAAFDSFREIFSQGTNELHSDTIASLVNSEKTIFERTREKSVAESRATIQKRLEEMQRVIVPKYIQWPLIAENTPEFFHRVKQFEQKMKKVLADEEKKESFDVSKYEIEVLAATAMESQDEELMDLEESDDTNTSSAMIPHGFGSNSMEEPLSPRLHHRVLSPISTSDSPSSSDGGRKWVPLSNVFHHMKKFDRNECARHFYAVLALLSSQNLDMNYDRHYSEESAAVVTQTLDHTQDSKYPRGLKIMTSRCPDADKEEIYVTALASKSCNEAFRDLISHEMNIHSDLQHHSSMKSPSRNNMKRSERFLSNGDLHSEPEVEEFVSMSCSTSFSGNLFGGRKKKQN